MGAMAGRGRGQSVLRGRGRGGVVAGEACRSGRAADFRAFDEVGFEGVQRGLPAALVDVGGVQSRRVAGQVEGGDEQRRGLPGHQDCFGDGRGVAGDVGEQSRRLAGRIRGGSTPTSNSAAAWVHEVSVQPTVGFESVGRDGEDSQEPHRSRCHGRGSGPVRPAKGKNFGPEEERQLTRSVLAISQDPICGNQQKGNAFWERIFLHYEQCRPGGHRGARSLESK